MWQQGRRRGLRKGTTGGGGPQGTAPPENKATSSENFTPKQAPGQEKQHRRHHSPSENKTPGRAVPDGWPGVRDFNSLCNSFISCELGVITPNFPISQLW